MAMENERILCFTALVFVTGSMAEVTHKQIIEINTET